MSKLTFLGTGGDVFTVGRGILGSGGIILELDGNQFHIDPGVGSIKAAKNAGIKLRRSVGILVSSAHLNHSHDLPAVLSAMSYGGLDPHGVVLAAKSVVEGFNNNPPVLSPHYAGFAERVLSLINIPRGGINSVDIRILPAKHTDPFAVGFQLISGDERISFTGDTGFSEDIVAAHKGATTLVCNLSLPEDESDPFRLSVVDVARLAELINPKVLVITHFSQKILRLDPRDIGRGLSTSVPCHVVVAEDGMELDPRLYY